MADERESSSLDRIIRRAQELDADRVDDGLDDEAIVAAAGEVGISAEAVRESMAIERFGPRPRRRMGDRLVGPGRIVVQRTVTRPSADVLDLLDDWLTSGHHLRRLDRGGDAGRWRKRTDVAANAQRAVKSLAGGAALGAVRIVEARVAPIGEELSLVRIEADRSSSRRATVGAAGGLGAASLAGGAAAAVVVPPLAAVAVPGLVLAGASTMAARRTAAKLDAELLRLLGQVGAGERPGLLGRLPRR
ncbi:MAG: hypothetical protein AAGA17_07650 [Actinomycetota bacterium]